MSKPTKRRPSQKPLTAGDERCTPLWFVDLIHHATGLDRFYCDPCSNRWSHVRSDVALTKRDDSLRARWDWSQWGSIYLQPPYSHPLPFVERFASAALEREQQRVPFVGIALLRGDWTTEYFRVALSVGDAWLLTKRLAYELRGGVDAGAKFPSVVFAVGVGPLFAKTMARHAIKLSRRRGASTRLIDRAA